MKITNTQKYLNLLYLVTALIITVGISTTNFSSSYSQPVPSISNETINFTNWNQTLINEPANIFCNESGECGGIVEVVFESDNTVVLESFNNYHIFRLADLIQNVGGFQIVDVSATTAQDGGIKYLVVMTK